MEFFEKKITYLRGLCDGTGYPKDSPEGKIFHGILDVLDDMAQMLNGAQEEAEVPLEAVSDQEEDAYYLFSCICPECGTEFEVDEETLSKQQEIPCPNCQNPIPVGAIAVDDLKF